MALVPPTLPDLQLRIRRFAEERDWLQFHDPKNLSMAIAVEAGELMDHFRWVANDRSRQVLDDPRSRAGIEEEAADVLILLAEFADVCGIDLLAAAGRKLEANALRYPVELSRGKATKHDRLGG
jgi:NTP pyrophosphatase (non-canonical NTP hydrolase)